MFVSFALKQVTRHHACKSGQKKEKNTPGAVSSQESADSRGAEAVYLK